MNLKLFKRAVKVIYVDNTAIISYDNLMEIIPGQNQPQNQNASVSNPVNASQSNQAETKDKKKFNPLSFIEESLSELFLIGLFSLLILGTFNYFNLIPLSSIFPVLSFLPHQQNIQTALFNTASQSDITYFNNSFQNLASCSNPNKDKNVILSKLIACSNPQQFSNITNEVIYQLIPTTDQADIGEKGVEVNFAIKADTNGKDDVGLMFGGSADENRFYVTYYPSQKAWGTQVLLGSSVTNFIPAYYPENPSNSQRAFFSLRVSGDGKTIALIFPNGDIETFNQNKDFYTKDGIFPVTAVLSPNSAITIYSLNYYNPQ